MKIAVIGIDFPLGKHSLIDEKTEKLKNIFHSQKFTAIQIDFEDSDHLKESDGILCEKNLKLDLLLPDLENIEGRLSLGQDKELFLRCKESLEKEILLNEIPLSDEENKLLLNLNLITLKPITFVDKENLAPIPEIIRTVYSNCGMISFFTVNERELRSWSIKKGATVYDAAGCIHSDIQRGFIKAEVVGFEDIIKSGGLNQARAKGLVKLEDRGYVVRDGDLVQIRFNV
jgi:hypothetical protein